MDNLKYLLDVKVLLGEYDERLSPMLFVYILSSYIDEPAILRTRSRMLELLDGGLPNDVESYLMGGICNKAITEKWSGYPSTPQERQERATEYWQNLKKGQIGSPGISSFGVRIPIDKFADAQAFLSWVLSLELLQSPSLFSATAGYLLHTDKYVYGKKFNTFLLEHPGFEYFEAGSTPSFRVSNIYSEQYQIVKPELIRINWLNALGNDAYLLMTGGPEGLQEAARQHPALVLRTLPHGFMVQAGPQPSPGENGRAPEAYYEATQLLEPFLTLSHYIYDDAPAGWESHFYTPARLKKVKERTALRSRILNLVD